MAISSPFVSMFRVIQAMITYWYVKYQIILDSSSLGLLISSVTRYDRYIGIYQYILLIIF